LEQVGYDFYKGSGIISSFSCSIIIHSMVHLVEIAVYGPFQNDILIHTPRKYSKLHHSKMLTICKPALRVHVVLALGSNPYTSQPYIVLAWILKDLLLCFLCVCSLYFRYAQKKNTYHIL